MYDELTDMLFEINEESQGDAVYALCSNGLDRWDIVDVLRNPYGEVEHAIIATAETALEAVQLAYNKICETDSAT